jgi:2-polyprenyl-6-methoxyphenol hydroxylase-like FAD-dependent oxidoreductase
MQERSVAPPLIVGAGPVGKGAALFLARDGLATRIIDEAEEPSRHSKALAVNPRTLEILEPTGITEKMLALGMPLRGLRLWRPGKSLAELSLARLKPKYPMLALSQATTERLLAEALEKTGVTVERGTKLVACRNAPDGVEAELRRSSQEESEMIRCPWLLAADGAHSTSRQQMNVDFPGTTFLRPWYLMDVSLATSLEGDWAHVVFVDGGGFVFAIRVIDETTRSASGDPLWRLMSNLPDPIERIGARQTAAPVWESTFHISHRINSRLRVNEVYFAGDAAHIHSPVGARGMNLGLEDAWVFSRLVKMQRMHRYESLRQPVDRRVMKRVELLSRMARGESLAARCFRSLLPSAVKIPPIYHRMLATIMGLDHPLTVA